MTRTIHKHVLQSPGATKLDLAHGARVLSVQDQRGALVLYEEHRRGGEPAPTRTFLVVETGEPFDTTGTLLFLGTVMMQGGAYVVHVYEVR